MLTNSSNGYRPDVIDLARLGMSACRRISGRPNVIKLSWKLHCFLYLEAATEGVRYRCEIPMVKKSKIVGDELVLMAKAIRRGEKLERTLTKLAALQEPRSPAEILLKAVQKGLEQLRRGEASMAGDKTAKGKDAGKTVGHPEAASGEIASRPKPLRRTKKAVDGSAVSAVTE